MVHLVILNTLWLQTMYVAEWTQEQGWSGAMRPYGPLQLEPSAQASPVLLHNLRPVSWSAIIDVISQWLQPQKQCDQSLFNSTIRT